MGTCNLCSIKSPFRRVPIHQLITSKDAGIARQFMLICLPALSVTRSFFITTTFTETEVSGTITQDTTKISYLGGKR